MLLPFSIELFQLQYGCHKELSNVQSKGEECHENEVFQGYFKFVRLGGSLTLQSPGTPNPVLF
jgi:hypothetical protein